jgi:YihY family inner membrane protein
MSTTDHLERLVRWFDDLQQDRRWLAQPIAVVRKYADDRGSALAGLLTFQVFLGLLPLLVIALTVFGRIIEGSDSLRNRVLDSTIAQFPVVGGRLRSDVGTLGVSGWWLYVTILGLLWTATGIYNGFQLTLNQVWNVGGVHRQGFVSRQLRAVALFVLVFGAAIGTSFLRQVSNPGSGVPVLDDTLQVLAGWLVSAALLLGVFRLVTAPTVRWRQLVPAAIVAGAFWTALQHLGRWIVLDRLASAQDLYGAIGFVVVTLTWINLLARSVVFANEVAVVHHRRLWPRRITQPPLTDADRQVLVDLLNNERRRPEEIVTVEFSDDDEPPTTLHG